MKKLFRISPVLHFALLVQLLLLLCLPLIVLLLLLHLQAHNTLGREQVERRCCGTPF